MKKTLAQSPNVPATYEAADVSAAQAMVEGRATPDQQKRFFKWIIETAGTYQAHYYDNDRDTAFALGKAFVGQQAIKLSKLDLATLRRNENG